MLNPIKLLYITNQICGPGGLERVLSIKTKYLIDTYKYNIHIITLNQDKKELFYDFHEDIIIHDITVNKSNPIHYFKKYRNGIKNILKRVQPNIILVCDDGLKGLLLPIFIKFNCPKIYERHVSKNIEITNDATSFTKNINLWTKFKLMEFGGSFYDKFVVLTDGNTKEWNLPNMVVIPNPLSFYPLTQSDLLNKKVIAVGKQCYQKGYDRLLNAWKLVNDKHPDWVLDIYGTINTEEGLQQLANELDITNVVNFHEPVKNIAEKYKEASIYVMSSRFEGFGMVLTEAMAYGVPCVSFNCPYGPGDIIKNGNDGFLVTNGDIEALSDKVNTLIEDESLRYQMGKQARDHVKRYLPDTIVKEWDTLFKQLIHNRL